MAKMNYEKAKKKERISKQGYEPVDKDCGDFGLTIGGPLSSARKGQSPSWVDGRVNSKRLEVRKQWLGFIEAAYRRGQQPTGIPRTICDALAREIETLRLRPDIRLAYAAALKKT